MNIRIAVGESPDVVVKLLDTFPHIKNYTPVEVVSIAGIGGLSEEDFLQLSKKLSKEEVKEYVKGVLFNAVVRGYASLTTSAYVAFSVSGSRVLDLFVTSYPFASFLVLSQRYVPVRRPQLPNWVSTDVKQLVKEQLEVYREMLESGIRREEARSVLGLGTPTHIFGVMAVESVSSMIKWGGDHPEIKEFVNKLEKEILDSDVADMYTATKNAPTMGGPFPHPFHSEKLEADDISIVSTSWNGSMEGINKYRSELERIRNSPPTSWKEMVDNVIKLSKISYTYSTEFSAVIRSSLPLTTFNELKRHRTVLQRIEGIYSAMEYRDFYIYPSLRSSKEFLDRYTNIIETFRKLDADKYEKVYAVPQGIKVGVEFQLNFHHLTAPSSFYRIRTCDTAEVSMKQFVRSLPRYIKDSSEYGKELFSVLTGNYKGSVLPISKCVSGACPEKQFCPLIYAINPSYNKEIHERIKKERKHIITNN